ncbi:MAG: hypothetical protein KAJ73_01125 [Zetaproteobacteria bacterium]|nr:hypothetical protein [Zetaproteobacteria bacterium]
MYYRRVEIVDGESVEPVQFVGFPPITFMIARDLNSDLEMIEPTAAFVESDEVEKLLRKIRAKLKDQRLFALVTLSNEIDALLGEKANG